MRGLLVLALCALSAPANATQGSFPWTPERAVAVRYVVQDMENVGSYAAGPGESIIWSPDRGHFFFITRRGDLEQDRNVYKLSVFASASVRAALSRAGAAPPRPVREVVMRSPSATPQDQGIVGARWVDSGTIAFGGVDNDEPNLTQGWFSRGMKRLYRLDIATGELARLSPEGGELVNFSMSGDATIFSTITTTYQPPTSRAYPIVPLQAGPGWAAQYDIGIRRTYRLYAGGRGRDATPLTDFSGGGIRGPWLSPDGRYAIVAIRPTNLQLPAQWRSYQGATQRNEEDFPRLMLIDIAAGTIRPIVDAPVTVISHGRGVVPLEVSWSPDSRRAIISGAALPLDDAAPERRASAYVAEFTVADGRFEPIVAIAPGAPVDGYWATKLVAHRDGFDLQYRNQSDYGRILSRINYVRRDDHWERTDEPAPEPVRPPQGEEPGFSVALVQGANQPHVVIASRGARRIDLTGPDPVVASLARAPLRSVFWTDPDGSQQEGGLFLPDLPAGSPPPPLVIQAYYHKPENFWPDGMSTSAYAAQSLVARGMAVLFLNLPGMDHVERSATPEEGPYFVRRIDQAVETLAGQGLIDRGRVGLVGFSRGGFMTLYAIAHPGRTRLAAAVSADPWTASYGEYISEMSRVSSDDAAGLPYVRQWGAHFWDDPQRWLAQAPFFNVQNSRSALLMTGGSEGACCFTEALAAFRGARRPLDYLSFPTGSHPFLRPKERAQSMTATVEWMSFWLQDRDPAPNADDPGRLERWHRIRETWRAVQAETLQR